MREHEWWVTCPLHGDEWFATEAEARKAFSKCIDARAMGRTPKDANRTADRTPSPTDTPETAG